MKVPRFSSGPAVGWIKNTMSEDGAKRLAHTLRTIWAECGHDVEFTVVEAGRGCGYGVRSNLVDGLPPEGGGT